jgi:hypothetical protein
LKVNGVIQTVQVLQDLGNKEDTFISTTGFYDMMDAQSAEILFASSAVDPFPEEKRVEEIAAIKKHGGNIDFKHLDDGIYAVPRGIPVFRFHIPIIPGHIYQRMIIEYETWTDYSVLDKVIKKLGVLTCCIGIILN